MKLLEQTLRAIAPQDPKVRARAKARLDQVTMPHWAMGRVMDLAIEVAGITGTLHPLVERRAITVFAADHGVAAEGVSKYPQDVTVQMTLNFVRGGAGINAMARVARAELVIVDLGIASELPPETLMGVRSRRIGNGCANIARGPAMTREQAIESIEAGIELARELSGRIDLFGIGEIGIGNTTPSSAILSALTGCGAEVATGRGSGIDDAQWKNKAAIVRRALDVNQPNPSDGLDVLARVGGFEIGGMAGLILGAAALHKPVVLDGFISSAAALVAQALAPASADAMIASHASVEPGHKLALAKLGKQPLFDLNLRLGEGTGAALAMPMVEGAVRILTEMATFDEANVSNA
jgi:nicotinate-nucleotide--dimethylbenzimidazole phosphoribosyltransferase